MRPIAERTEQLVAMHEQIFGPQVPAANVLATGGLPSFVDVRDSDLNPTFGPDDLPRTVATLTDEELLDRARAAANGAKFQRLWSGDWSGYSSQSEADAALCSMLAFWTGADANRMDALFRRSGLYRSKWDARRGAQTYGERTIARAIARTSEVFEPPVEIPDLPTETLAAMDLDTIPLERV